MELEPEGLHIAQHSQYLFIREAYRLVGKEGKKNHN